MGQELRLLVLGATGGIGTAVVERAVEMGCHVLAFGRARDKLDALKGISGSIEFDIGDANALDRAFQEVAKGSFVPNAAVNCFGITRRGPFLSQTADQWDEVVNINLKGTWRCMQLEAQTMLEHGAGGSIVNVASVAGYRGNKWGEAPYIASKHGVLGLTRAAALELGPLGIRVNAVCPSVVETPLSRYAGFSGQELQRLSDKHPNGRLVTSDEIARAMLWLCSNASSGINGAIIPVDGGLTAS